MSTETPDLRNQMLTALKQIKQQFLKESDYQALDMATHEFRINMTTGTDPAIAEIMIVTFQAGFCLGASCGRREKRDLSNL